MEDAAVMAQVQDGRVERLAVLFERHHLHLFNFFLRLTGQRAVSEDLVQEVFLRLLRYRAGFRPDAPFGPWMWEIARNAFRDHLQGLRPHQALEDLPEGLPDKAVSADAILMRDQDCAHLQRALAQLPPAKRELLLLSRNPDLGYKDLASLMACSVGNVKVQVHRALKDLKTVFFSLQGGLS